MKHKSQPEVSFTERGISCRLLPIGTDHRARWHVSHNGQSALFTCEEWIEHGANWLDAVKA